VTRSFFRVTTASVLLVYAVDGLTSGIILDVLLTLVFLEIHSRWLQTEP